MCLQAVLFQTGRPSCPSNGMRFVLEITTRVRLIRQMVEITKVVAHSQEGGIIALFAKNSLVLHNAHEQIRCAFPHEDSFRIRSSTGY